MTREKLGLRDKDEVREKRAGFDPRVSERGKLWVSNDQTSRPWHRNQQESGATGNDSIQHSVCACSSFWAQLKKRGQNKKNQNFLAW